MSHPFFNTHLANHPHERASLRAAPGELSSTRTRARRRLGLLLGLALCGAASFGRAQDDMMLPPLDALPEEVLSNALAVASEMLQPEGFAATNGAPATPNAIQRPASVPGQTRPPGESRSQKDSRSQSGERDRNERDPRRKTYRQSYDTVKARDTFSTNDRASTNAPSRTNSGPMRLDYGAFSIVAERNIFNPNRSSSRKANEGPTSKPKVVESISLVGTMSYEKGTFAFFDGSSSSFRKALKPADSIGGCKLTEVGANSVRLTVGTNVFELKVGAQLRREEEGEWRVSSQPASYVATSGGASGSSGSTSTSSTTTSSSSGSSSGVESDVLKRMMQRREQE